MYHYNPDCSCDQCQGREPVDTATLYPEVTEGCVNGHPICEGEGYFDFGDGSGPICNDCMVDYVYAHFRRR